MMARFYTGSGDRGETSLTGGLRVGKDDPRVEALGALDEANCMIGLARSFNLPVEVDGVLERVQAEIFEAGLDVISPLSDKIRVDDIIVKRLEEDLNSLAGRLPNYSRFVLPNGSPSVASLHLARSVVRRAERRVVSLARSSATLYPVVKYLNRLSSLLYVAARYTALKGGVVEKEWVSGEGSGG